MTGVPFLAEMRALRDAYASLGHRKRGVIQLVASELSNEQELAVGMIVNS